MKKYYARHDQFGEATRECDCHKPCTLMVKFEDVQQLVHDVLPWVTGELTQCSAAYFEGHDCNTKRRHARIVAQLRAILGGESPAPETRTAPHEHMWSGDSDDSYCVGCLVPRGPAQG